MKFPSIDLTVKAYEEGLRQQTPVARGYYLSPDGNSVFCQTLGSPRGVVVGADAGNYTGIPEGYTHFNMSKAYDRVCYADF
jgi:hypothetical protein